MKKFAIFLSGIVFGGIDLDAVPYKKYGRKNRPKFYFSAATMRAENHRSGKRNMKRDKIEDLWIEELQEQRLVYLLLCGQIVLREQAPMDQTA
jgi:hypothetical protein